MTRHFAIECDYCHNVFTKDEDIKNIVSLNDLTLGVHKREKIDAVTCRNCFLKIFIESETLKDEQVWKDANKWFDILWERSELH